MQHFHKTFMLRELNPCGENSRKRILKLSFGRWSAILNSIFLSFSSRLNDDPAKKMEEAIPKPNNDFNVRLCNLKQNLIFSPDLKNILIKIPINENHLLLVQLLPSNPTAHAQV